VPHSSIPARSRAKAKTLRRIMTDAERRLWSALRGHRLTDLHFRRQVPFGSYVADFACHAARVIIEVDGGQHGAGEHVIADMLRDEWFASQGYLTLRFWNHEVFKGLDIVRDTIYERCVERLPESHVLRELPPSLPSPTRGEEEQSLASFAKSPSQEC
jgi:very-short-patch-repair endonuclease